MELQLVLTACLGVFLFSTSRESEAHPVGNSTDDAVALNSSSSPRALNDAITFSSSRSPSTFNDWIVLNSSNSPRVLNDAIALNSSSSPSTLNDVIALNSSNSSTAVNDAVMLSSNSSSPSALNGAIILNSSSLLSVLNDAIKLNSDSSPSTLNDAVTLNSSSSPSNLHDAIMLSSSTLPSTLNHTITLNSITIPSTLPNTITHNSSSSPSTLPDTITLNSSSSPSTVNDATTLNSSSSSTALNNSDILTLNSSTSTSTFPVSNASSVDPSEHTEVTTVTYRMHDQPTNQIADQMVTKMNDDSKIHENFQHLFDSIATNNTKKGEAHREVLERQVAKEREASDTMKKEIRIARIRSSLNKIKFYNNNTVSGKVAAMVNNRSVLENPRWLPDWRIAKKSFRDLDDVALIELCEAARSMAGFNETSVSAAYANVSTLRFKNENYRPMRIDVVGCDVENDEGADVEGNRFYITEGTRANCFYYLAPANVNKTEYYLDEHVCGQPII